MEGTVITNGQNLVEVSADGMVTNEFNPAANAPATIGQQLSPMQVSENVDGVDYIVDLTSRQTSYCSMTPQDDTDRAILFNAMNNPAKRLSDCINEAIRAKHIFVEVVTCEKKDADGKPTGQKDRCPRIVIIDDHGIGYACVSVGVYSAIKKLFQVYGEPQTWTKPIPLKIKQVTKGDRKMLTLEMLPLNK